VSIGLWAVLGVVGYAVLFGVFRIAGLGSSPTHERRPLWLLLLGVAGIVIGFILLVMTAESGQ
jgi:hypothetical protein